uniref:cysteine dioxygenase n=1 Tax=Oryza sativa subsp. japonica TaxID=39947 RepID=Q84SI5_ORYSJ|nr:HGWP repeat containing protein-like protein [Oryza sativa Japonica Group]
MPPPTRLAYYAAAVGRLRLHRRLASVAADWCLRLHGWPIMPPLLGVYDFTAGLPPSPPIGASAYTAGLLCRRCWASTTSPPAYLRRRRVVPPPTRLAYYAAAVGRLRFHRRPASVAADWCPRLYGWLVTPPFMGVHASAYTAGLLCRRCWASTTSPPACLRRRRLVPPPTRLAYYAAAVGRLRLHRRPASVAADWCLRLHGWPIMPPLLGVYDFTAGLPPSPPIGASAYTAGLLCRRCWASTTSPPACLRRRRLVPPPTRLAYYAAAVGRLRLHHRPASVAADWCPRLYGRLVTPPLMGIVIFTAGLPPSPPTGASAYTAGLLCRRCWASSLSPSTAFVAADWNGSVRTSPPAASSAADWCFRLHGWPIMPPLLGVYVFTDRLAFAAADWCFRLHGWPLCRRCWASTSSPTGRLVRRRLVLPPARLAYYAAVVGRLRLHRPAASSAADWCFRLHGWPIMPPLLGVYVFTDRLAFAAADWCFRLHGWPLCRRCWASTSSPTGRLVRRRLVLPPARLAYYAAVVGRLRLHRPAASSAADWCHRLHGWPIMPPLLGVYVFTDRLAFAAADWCFRLHSWPIMPPLLDVYVFTDRLAFAAADWCFRLHGWPIMPPLLGVYVFTDRLAFAAADWCFRLHGWPIMPPLLGVYVFTDRPPRPPPTGVTACTAGLLCRRC